VKQKINEEVERLLMVSKQKDENRAMREIMKEVEQ
jgi:hypothetical protein